MSLPDSVPSIPKLELSVYDVRPGQEDLLLWLPPEMIGIWVVRSFDFVRRFNDQRLPYDRGSCGCCDHMILQKPEGLGEYGRSARQIVRNNFYKPTSESKYTDANELEERLLRTAMPAELMIWEDITMTSHSECYTLYGKPFGDAQPQGLALTRNTARNRAKVFEATKGRNWLVPATIVTITE